MKVYNTLTREKEELKTIVPGEVRMYACGPTVYNFIHIGNARPIIVFDTLRRYLEYRGYKVKFVQNFTDVDDKIIKKANEEGVESIEISETLHQGIQNRCRRLERSSGYRSPQSDRKHGQHHRNRADAGGQRLCL